MLKDPEQPITAKLRQIITDSSAPIEFTEPTWQIRKHKKNCFVQKYLRFIKDGTDNLYFLRNLKNYNTTIIKVNNVPSCEVNY